MSFHPDKPWPAPAKLNLMLRILGRRPDGYHLLQTVFQFVDASDELYFRVRRDGLIRRLSPLAGVPEDQDLVVRAARLLQQEAGVVAGADIRLEKRLPMGGGLGGGSSDAATTLVALNRLWDLGLGAEQLAGLGLRLGADVPVFIRGQAAWAEGVGESLSPVDLPEPWYLILVPPCHVSTAEIFADPELTRDSPRITIADFLSGRAENDCLAVVRRHYPPVADALDWLGRFAEPRLTGTGGCVFAAFEDEGSARSVLRQLRGNCQGLVVRGMNRSPLLAAAAG
ncbi:MAG TPA: 4-(cytidine 5'-diphospho)-2-C-methyl-D-erythritol kinase [Sedimenticola sp.]|nr:4-(cytidine 5'-diphospho)-2-C-methyl-D-erythritol kinase [Sedimenticola sp.]